MSPILTRRQVRLAVLVAVIVGVVALGLPAMGVPLLPSLGERKSPDSSSGTEFHPVDGDGELPERRPQLQPRDAPLSVAERGYAIHLARQAMPRGSTDVLGMPGGEVLAADLPATEDRGDGRRATVSIYDYSSDHLHQALVDLGAGSVVRSREVTGLQLPPTIAETTIATQVALAADPAPAFADEYRRITGSSLVAAEQVHAVASVWRIAADPTAPDGPTKVCGRDRCVQLQLALPSGQYLDTQDFAVDLSSRTLLPVGPGEAEHHHDD